MQVSWPPDWYIVCTISLPSLFWWFSCRLCQWLHLTNESGLKHTWRPFWTVVSVTVNQRYLDKLESFIQYTWNLIKSREMECRFWKKKSHFGGWNTKLKGLVYWIEFKPFKLRFFKRLFLFNEGKTGFSNLVLPPEVLICLCYKGRTVVAIFCNEKSVV